MKYTIKPTSKFQKDLKRVQKRGYDLNLLKEIINKLV
ncbi:MAG: type II toxin-antitoxin system YafQ family toxin [Coprococcus sp.]